MLLDQPLRSKVIFFCADSSRVKKKELSIVPKDLTFNWNLEEKEEVKFW